MRFSTFDYAALSIKLSRAPTNILSLLEAIGTRGRNFDVTDPYKFEVTAEAGIVKFRFARV